MIRSSHDKLRVWNALIIREIMARYGHGNFGFLWLIIEPLLLTGGVIVMWSVLYGESKHGLNIVPFVLTGYSMLTLWRHMIGTSTRCFSRSSDILYHRQISPFDVIVAKQLTEIIGVFTSFSSAYLFLLLTNFSKPIDDYLLLLSGWFLMSFFTFGVGLIIASLTELSEAAEHFIAPAMYVLIPVTGAFYMVGWMPVAVRELMAYVPNINAMEMFRAGYFGPGVPTYWDAGYLVVCAIGVNVVGLAMLTRALAKLEG